MISVNGVTKAKTPSVEERSEIRRNSFKNTFNIFLIVVRKNQKSKENYSLLSASIGFIFAALYAGYIQKNNPIQTENESAKSI